MKNTNRKFVMGAFYKVLAQRKTPAGRAIERRATRKYQEKRRLQAQAVLS